jgi:hypothetical protein
LALTAFKASRTKAQQATDDGTTAATQLTNSLLTAQYVPAMQLPEPVDTIQGLKAAAVDKLGRRQQQHLQQLLQTVQQLRAAVVAMEHALADVRLQQTSEQQQHADAGSATASHAADTVGAHPDAGRCVMQHPDQVTPQPGQQAGGSMPPASLTAGSAAQCSSTPVFYILTLHEITELLQQVLSMHQQDLRLKQQLYEGFADEVAATCGGDVSKGRSSSSHANIKQAPAWDAAEALRKCLTVLITCWMTKPHVDDDAAAHMLTVLTDEMTGF